MSEIIIKDVSFSYGKKIVLKDLNLTIPKGMFGLVGRNGAGKTTLMKLLVGLLPLTQGQIHLSSQVGYLPQDFDFYPGMSVYESLIYLGTLDGMKHDVLVPRIKELLHLVNLMDKSKHKVKTLSGGMKQRLGIAQSLLNDPPILIVDEPTAGLDPEERIRFRNLLSDLAQDKTIILSTHIASDLESSSSLLAILDQGEIVFHGSIDHLLEATQPLTYETTIPRSELSEYKKQYLIYEQRDLGENMQIKLISHGIPKDSFKRTRPSLEAAYLNAIHFREALR